MFVIDRLGSEQLYTWGLQTTNQNNQTHTEYVNKPNKFVGLQTQFPVSPVSNTQFTYAAIDQDALFFVSISFYFDIKQIQINNNILYAHGSQNCGKLGVNQRFVIQTLKPVPVAFPFKDVIVRGMSLGKDFAMCWDCSGRLFAWGCAMYGKLGLACKQGHYNYKVYTPTHVESLSEECIVQASCGEKHTIALNKRGVVYSWGYQTSQDIDYRKRPNPVNFAVPIDKICALPNFNLAMNRATGKLYSWDPSVLPEQDSFYPTPVLSINSYRMLDFSSNGSATVAIMSKFSASNVVDSEHKDSNIKLRQCSARSLIKVTKQITNQCKESLVNSTHNSKNSWMIDYMAVGSKPRVIVSKKKPSQNKQTNKNIFSPITLSLSPKLISDSIQSHAKAFVYSTQKAMKEIQKIHENNENYIQPGLGSVQSKSFRNSSRPLLYQSKTHILKVNNKLDLLCRSQQASLHEARPQSKKQRQASRWKISGEGRVSLCMQTRPSFKPKSPPSKKELSKTIFKEVDLKLARKKPVVVSNFHPGNWQILDQISTVLTHEAILSMMYLALQTRKQELRGVYLHRIQSHMHSVLQTAETIRKREKLKLISNRKAVDNIVKNIVSLRVRQRMLEGLAVYGPHIKRIVRAIQSFANIVKSTKLTISCMIDYGFLSHFKVSKTANHFALEKVCKHLKAELPMMRSIKMRSKKILIDAFNLKAEKVSKPTIFSSMLPLYPFSKNSYDIVFPEQFAMNTYNKGTKTHAQAKVRSTVIGIVLRANLARYQTQLKDYTQQKAAFITRHVQKINQERIKLLLLQKQPRQKTGAKSLNSDLDTSDYLPFKEEVQNIASKIPGFPQKPDLKIYLILSADDKDLGDEKKSFRNLLNKYVELMIKELDKSPAI